MRHRKRRTKLSMMTAHRNATIKNMVRSLLIHQRIETTLRRAKEARRLAEHMITLAKTDSVAARRRAYSILTDRDMVAKLFKEIAPLFKERKSGYTRIIPLGFRRGDGASLAILELTDRKIVEKLPKKKKEKAKVDAEAKVKAEPEAKGKEAKEARPHKGATVAEAQKEGQKEEPKAKVIPKSKPTLDEEKKAEKAKTEGKKIEAKKTFIKNLRGFFRRKTDM